MKKYVIMSLVFLSGMLLTVQSSTAQVSDKTKRQLYINGQGEISDRGIKLGYISKEDIVYNSQGKKLGFIKNGKVYDADGNFLGKAKKGGRYYNNSGEYVLSVKGNNEKCEILDARGHSLGYIHKNYKLHACAAHCFFREKSIVEDLDAIMTSYSNIADALFNDNGNSAKDAAAILLGEDTALNMTFMKKSLEELAGTSDLESQRIHFAKLSDQLYTILKEAKPEGQTIYWNHCPMAQAGKGAHWLSPNEKINNPYMGQRMPGCGSTKELLK